MCFLARAAPSGESLRGEGLVWLIGAVVCLLAACRGSNCTLTRAINGRNLRCSTIGSCQSTATSYDCTARLVVSSAIEESDLYLFHLYLSIYPSTLFKISAQLVSWSLKSLFSTNMATPETKGQWWRAKPTQ